MKKLILAIGIVFLFASCENETAECAYRHSEVIVSNSNRPRYSTRYVEENDTINTSNVNGNNIKR